MVKRFCFIGHVDTGKSTTAGHLVYKCGNITDHEFSKHKKDCLGSEFAFWSRFLDIYEEERAKSKTHEFTILDLKHDNEEYQLVDTPGHKAFIRSLIEGISRFPGLIGCIVISARSTEFEAGWKEGQTREDIILTKSVGIEDVVILINKMDSIDWDQKVFDDIVKKVQPFVNACKFRSSIFIPVSGYDGIGLIDLKGLPDWYNGPYLMSAIKEIKLVEGTGIEPISINEWTKFSASIKLLKVNGVITSGYNFVLHYGGKEYEASLEKINKKVFLKEKESGLVIIKSKTPITKGNNRRIILRDGTFTIGFGKIEKIFTE